MSVELATFITDLVTSNPPASDLETQGADHLRLIKTTLQNVFGTSVRRLVGLPGTTVLTTSTVLTAAGAANVTHLISTAAGAVTITLPNTLGALDTGWECSFIKTTSDVNPILIAPPSGTLQSGEYAGLTLARRCIPGRRTRCLWTGSSFLLERVSTHPIGGLVDYIASKTLPVGFEWPNGQVLSSALNYPEYFALIGSGNTPDFRGRASFGQDDMGGVAANRITAALNFNGTILNNAGGSQQHSLQVSECPTGIISYNFNDPGHAHGFAPGTVTIPGAGGAAGTANGTTGQSAGTSVGGNGTNISSSITDNAGNGAHSILPPAITCPKLLVVE